MENKAVTARYNRMLDALDLAIDWCINPPAEGTEITPKWAFLPGAEISSACDMLGCTEAEKRSLVDEWKPNTTPNLPLAERKLVALLKLREKYAQP